MSDIHINHRKPWTGGDVVKLLALREENKSLEDISKILDRSEAAVECRLCMIGRNYVDTGMNMKEVLEKIKVPQETFELYITKKVKAAEDIASMNARQRLKKEERICRQLDEIIRLLKDIRDK